MKRRKRAKKSIYPSIFCLCRFCDINYLDDVTEKEISSKQTDLFHTFIVNGIERITSATARIDSDRQPDGTLMHVGTRFACRYKILDKGEVETRDVRTPSDTDF